MLHLDIPRVRETVQALVEEHRPPGIAVGVVRGNELAYAESFGFADIESKRPQDPTLRHRIGSVTKTMTALCVMALVAEGRLSLDDRAVELLPDVTFHGPVEALTLRHLLTHTGGIGEAPMPDDLRNFRDYMYTNEPDRLSIHEMYPRGITIEAAPGSKWAYANIGFALLGEIIARKEGAPIDKVMQRRIFDPLGMANTDCRDERHPIFRSVTTARPVPTSARCSSAPACRCPMKRRSMGTTFAAATSTCEGCRGARRAPCSRR